MLVLSRKVGERIQLGQNITVTIVKIQGNAVRLGIEAPPNMTVVREESPSRFTLVGNVPTAPGARTLALDPRTHRVYLVTAEFGPPPPPRGDGGAGSGSPIAGSGSISDEGVTSASSSSSSSS